MWTNVIFAALIACAFEVVGRWMGFGRGGGFAGIVVGLLFFVWTVNQDAKNAAANRMDGFKSRRKDKP